VCFVSHFTSCRSYVQYRSYSPNNTISVVFSWFSHSHLIMRSRVTNFLSSVNLLPASTSLSAIFSLTIDRSLFTSSFLLLYIFGHFNNRWDSRLATGRSGDRIPLGSRISASVRTDPPTLPYNVFLVIPGGKAAEACR